MKKIFFLAYLFATFSFLSCDKTPIEPDNPKATRDNPLILGNPSDAKNEVNAPNNYLMEKPQFALSYNSSRGGANWVAWHLSSAWKGGVARQDDFRADPDLPTSFTKIVTGDYTNTGFDRGHLCPSDDRDSTVTDNSATFVMTNMLPQSPNLNRITWKNLEDYCRKLMEQGNELYIFAGGYGVGGNGSNGDLNTFASGKVTVPARCWKVVVVLPINSNDLTRIDANTRVIAVDMPNTQSVNANAKNWGDYRVKVDDIEAATGYNFMSAVATNIQSTLESKIDTGPTN